MIAATLVLQTYQQNWVNLASDGTANQIDTTGWIVTGSECPDSN